MNQDEFNALCEKVWDKVVADRTTPTFDARLFLAPFKGLAVQAVEFTLDELEAKKCLHGGVFRGEKCGSCGIDVR